MQLDGTVALVTGGAQGLGLSIARDLRRHGAKVIVADKNTAALETLQGDLVPVEMDATSPDQVNSVIGNVTETHGPCTILVNNAGVIFSEPFVNILSPNAMMHDYARFKASLEVNLNSVFIVSSAVVEQLVRRRKEGVIINVSSISARGNEGQTAYSAAKAGVEAMTVVWSKELGRFGIRVNAIAPGFVDTSSTRRALNQTTIDHIEKNTPVRRMGDVEELSAGVRSLIENDFINGAILDVNGGLTI